VSTSGVVAQLYRRRPFETVDPYTSAPRGLGGAGVAGVAVSPTRSKRIRAAAGLDTDQARQPRAPSQWRGVMTLMPAEFVNAFSKEDAAAAYSRYAVPATGQILYERRWPTST
jgi:hypothetical protein